MQSKSTEDIVVESADVVSWRDLTVYRIYVRGGEWQMLDFLAKLVFSFARPRYFDLLSSEVKTPKYVNCEREMSRLLRVKAFIHT